MNLFKAMAVANPEAASQAIPVIDVGPAFRGEPGGLEAVAGTPLRGKNLWPAGHERMRATMVRYMKAMEALGERTLPLLARALDMPADHFAPFFRDEAHITTRFLHYPPQETDDDEQFGQGPHTDNSFITFLAREDTPGLAVRLPSGEWLSPPVIPGTFLVNLGNIMKRWSNDR